MQNKSEMINRIAELAEENAELNAIIDSYQPRLQALKDENFELKESLKCFQKPEVVKVLTDYRTGEIDNLKAENERLKEEVETRDKLVEHFRKEAINWAKIANDCIKDIESCACKVKFTFEEAIEQQKKTHQHFYKCIFCQGYHFTSQLDYEQMRNEYYSKVLKGQKNDNEF